MTVKNKADINNPTVLTGYLVDGNMSVPLDDRNRHYKMVQEWIAEGNIPEPAYTDEELLIHAKRDKSVEILTTQKDMAIAFWSSDSTVYSMTKQKIDTNTRVSELQALIAPTQDETDELVEYGTYFDINKLTNSERYTFLNDVDTMTTVAEVEAYTYSFSAYPDVTNQTDESLTNAQFFIRYGFIMAT